MPYDFLLVIEMFLSVIEKTTLIRVFSQLDEEISKIDYHKWRVYYMTYKLNAYCIDFYSIDPEMFTEAGTPYMSSSSNRLPHNHFGFFLLHFSELL
jgi:hypothetical protein